MVQSIEIILYISIIISIIKIISYIKPISQWTKIENKEKDI